MPIAFPRPHADVQIDNAQATRRHRVAIGHRHHRHFLQAEDVLKPPIAHQGIVERHFGRAGIAENVPHTKAGEEVEKGVDSSEGHDSNCSRIAEVCGGR